ncbi:hypothetical protein LMG27952_06716 [Paraburkholderia hiiakae]|uniref:Secreted protein n=1 Tax=Paraburkholderia hiiakae TaxID=1081782 RepID=A0ABN7IGS5_9BURK|nr:hypothetical protein [Paraburkholderia hiiakae]CAD6558805.1 hypothetical protein LMG27952_06716 [Paraburkholderia hiiakae]
MSVIRHPAVVLLLLASAPAAVAECPAKAADIRSTTEMRACFDALAQGQAQLKAQQAQVERRLATLAAQQAVDEARLSALPDGMMVELRNDGEEGSAHCMPHEVLVGGMCWAGPGSALLQNAGITDDPKNSPRDPRIYTCTWNPATKSSDFRGHTVAACLRKQ